MKYEIQFCSHWVDTDTQNPEVRKPREVDNEILLRLLEDGWEVLTSWADQQYMHRANFILRKST